MSREPESLRSLHQLCSTSSILDRVASVGLATSLSARGHGTIERGPAHAATRGIRGGSLATQGLGARWSPDVVLWSPRGRARWLLDDRAPLRDRARKGYR